MVPVLFSRGRDRTAAQCHDQHTLEVKVDICGICHEGVAAEHDLEDIRFMGFASDYDGEARYNAFTARLLKATFNYQYVKKDPGAFAHNGMYIVQILQNTLKDFPGYD